MNAFARFLAGGSISQEALSCALRDSLVAVDAPLRQYSSFFLRLALAAVIAAGGIAAGSSAVVIGAMLIAPLMSPIWGTALATVTGRPKSAVRTLGVTVAGVALCIAIAAAIAAVIPVGVNTATNSEVVSRTAPRLVDLVVALASGLMAAVALIRDDIPDAVPGIAISASIVPPLCVVGIALQGGDVPSALGALLLFATNYVAIQIMCCAAFAAMGLGAKAYSETAGRMRAAWYAAVALGAVAVFVPLAVTSADVVDDAARQRFAAAAAREWLDGSDYRLRSLALDDGLLSVEIAGSGAEPSLDRFAETLEEHDVAVSDVRVSSVEERRMTLEE